MLKRYAQTHGADVPTNWIVILKRGYKYNKYIKNLLWNNALSTDKVKLNE